MGWSIVTSSGNKINNSFIHEGGRFSFHTHSGNKLELGSTGCGKFNATNIVGAKGLNNYELYKAQTGNNITYEEWVELERQEIAAGINSGAISTELESRVSALEDETDGLVDGVDYLTLYRLKRDN